MKRFTLLLCCTLLGYSSFSQYTSCAAAAAATPMASGSCLTGQNATVGAPAANCGGGFNSGVGLFFPFTAGTCPQFDLTFNDAEEIQFLVWTTGCSLVPGSIECSEVISGNQPISESWSATSGPTLTNGTTYVLEVLTDNASTFDICYTASMPEDPSNECSGAAGLSPGGQTFFNGGNCAFSGSLNDATTSDPAANLLCAGSLENTQWINFQPTAGALSFQIIGTNIECAGPVCGWQFGIFSGSCALLTAEGCVSDGDYCTNGPDGASSSIGSTADGFALSWSGISDNGFTATVTETGGTPFDGTENFYLIMDGNANSDCQFTLDGVNIQPLPIELISFHAVQYNDANRIIWEVASEENNDFFTVERSLDGIDWRDVAVVNGAGTSDEQRKYAILDNSFEAAYNYYRLKQTDFDGKFEYSKVITVDNSETVKTLLKTVNSMGQEVNPDFKGIVIDIYSDGTSEKRFQ